jgi:hypothetical protein
MSKLKSTIKVGLHPILENGTDKDNSFIFSSDITDWQKTKKRKYTERTMAKKRGT